MDLVQLTTHIDATAVRVAAGTPDAFATRESGMPWISRCGNARRAPRS